MANGLVKIATTTATGGTVTELLFSSIPSTFTDLLVIYSARITATDTSWHMRVNGLSTSIYTGKYIQGYNTSANSGSWNSTDDNLQSVNSSSYTTDAFASGKIYFPNYTSSTTKTYSSETAAETAGAVAGMFMGSGQIATNSAISSIRFYYAGASDIAQYSSATLYGILKA